MHTAIRNLCRFLVLAMISMPFSTVHAGMLTTEQAWSTELARTDRTMVLDRLSRTEVATQLASLGVDPAAARERVAAMTDDEVRVLNGKLESLPTGGDSGAWWFAAGAIIVAVIIWYLYYR